MRIGVLASGGGTNLRAILEADLPVVVVVVDRPCGATRWPRRVRRAVSERADEHDPAPNFRPVDCSHRRIELAEQIAGVDDAPR